MIFGYRLISWLARVAPSFVFRAIDSLVVPVLCSLMRRQRKIVGLNMRRVNPSLSDREIKRIVRRAYESYARYYIETFRLPLLGKAAIDSGVEVLGFEHIQNALAKGKGVILALPHLGGWEWSGRWLIHQGHELHAVVERLKNDELFAMFMHLRKSYGVSVIPLDDNAGVAVQEALAKNQIVALLCDRDLQGNGVEVDFFGESTTVPAGPAFFALRTGAALVPIGTYFAKGFDQHQTLVMPPINVSREESLRDDIKRVAQELTKSIEVLIRRAPDQWHLFQPNWPSDKAEKLSSDMHQTIG
ncbi:MAG TPA: phosphatidylinositol mannoside acyltransferase [Acidimicrobium sp.]|nr:phosphatidylinositol mannoside acyltransferase [Acidimicrobium sp.]